MRYLFDQDDERTVLSELAHNQHKAELLSQTCKRQGKTRGAANWANSAQQIGFKIELLTGIFQHKN